MDANTQQALSHPSLKLIAGAGGIAIAAGVAIYFISKRKASGATSGAGTNPVDGSSVGTYAPTSFSLYTTTPATSTSVPAGSSSTSASGGSSSTSSSGSGGKTTTPKSPGKTKTTTRKTTTKHPRKTAATSPKSPGATGAKLATAATHAGGSSSSASSKSGSSKSSDTGGGANRLPPVTRSAVAQLNTPGSAPGWPAQALGNLVGGVANYFGIGQ